MNTIQKAERAATLVQSIKSQQAALTGDERRYAELALTIEARKKSIKSMTDELDELFTEKPPFMVGQRVVAFAPQDNTGFEIYQVDHRADGVWWIQSHGSRRWYRASEFRATT